MPVRFRATLCLVSLGCVTVLFVPSAPAVGEEKKPANSNVSFSKDIRPLLADKCGNCHGPKKAKKGIDVTSYGTTMKIVKAGKPDESRLMKSLVGSGAKQMPPKNALPEEQIAKVKAWIAAGAKNN